MPSPSTTPVPRSSNLAKLWVLMLAAFIDMVGALIIIPLLPFYATDFGANGLVFTSLVASFSAMTLISAPLWGRVSDRYGRKPTLIIGLTASAIGYVIFAFADSLWLLFLSRVVQGAGGGTVGVIQAYVADAMEPKNRARGLGWLSAATNMGVTLGPLIGSLSSSLGRQAPGLIATGLCLLNIGFAWRFLSESHGAAARARAMQAISPFAAVGRVLNHSSEPASRLIWIYAIGIGAFMGITAILSLFLMDRFGATERTIGYFFAYVGILNVISRAGLLGRVVDRLGEARTSRLGASLLAVGLATVPLTHSIVTLALAVALIPLGTAFLFPSVTALLSQVVGDHERGLYMGVQQTFGGLARVFYPLWVGFAWDHFDVAVPFWTSATLVAGTILLGLGMEGYTKQKPDEQVLRTTAELAAKEAGQAAVVE